jgi:hypothetical protein
MLSAVESFMANWKDGHLAGHSTGDLDELVENCRADLGEAGFTEDEVVERFGMRIKPLLADALRFEQGPS